MALKKSIAGYWKKWIEQVEISEGVFVDQQKEAWIEQQDVEMHPVEEKEILAHWAVGDSIKVMPNAPTREEEHEWLIEHGAEFVKGKRAEHKNLHDEWLKTHQPLMDNHKSAVNEYLTWCESDEGKNYHKEIRENHEAKFIK